MMEAPTRFAGFRPAAFTFLGELCVSDYDAGGGPPTVTSTRRSWPGVGSLLLSPCPLTARAVRGTPSLCSSAATALARRSERR